MIRRRRNARHQRGAAALEFALLFIPLFVVFYAIAGYGLVFSLAQGLTLAAEEGARAALVVDPAAFSDTDSYRNSGVTPQVRQQVATSLSWLPDTVRQRVLGDANGNVGVSFTGNVVEVLVEYPDYATAPLIPVLTFPGIGTVPRVPADIQGRAAVAL